MLVFGFEQVQAHGQRPQVKTVSRLTLYWLQCGTQHATPLYIYDPKVHLATPYPIGTYRQPVRHGVGCYAELKTQFSLFLCRCYSAAAYYGYVYSSGTEKLTAILGHYYVLTRIGYARIGDARVLERRTKARTTPPTVRHGVEGRYREVDHSSFEY